MPKQILLFVCLFITSTGYPLTVLAQIDDDLDSQYCPGPAIAVQEEDQSFFTFLNSPHKDASSGLEWLSKRIDTFFANEDLYEESTGSFARLTASTILREGGKQSYLGDLSVRLELPHTKKKLKLIIETDADKNLENRPGQLSQPTPNQALSETTYFAGVEQKLAEKSLWDVSTSTGIRIRSPLDPFVRLRMKREVVFKYWKFRFTETLFHFHSSGTGHNSTFEWDRPMSKKDLFRWHTTATWWDDTDHYELSNSLSFFHEITDRRALAYSISVFGSNKPTVQADTYLFDVRYRQRIHKDWLYYEINPQVLYEKINNFTPEKTLTLKLEMIFGDKYL